MQYDLNVRVRLPAPTPKQVFQVIAEKAYATLSYDSRRDTLRVYDEDGTFQLSGRLAYDEVGWVSYIEFGPRVSGDPQAIIDKARAFEDRLATQYNPRQTAMLRVLHEIVRSLQEVRATLNYLDAENLKRELEALKGGDNAEDRSRCE